MNYYIVFQNQTYLAERDGGYLWAPQKNKLNQSLFHWENMKKLKSGDIVYSMYKQHLYSINIVTKSAEEKDNPFKSELSPWGEKGWIVQADYNELSYPVSMKENMEGILKLCPDKYSPFSSSGRGNQGYLYEVNKDLGNHILSLAKQKNKINL